MPFLVPKKKATLIAVDRNTQACLIEGDNAIDYRLREMIAEWLNKQSIGLTSPAIQYSSYMQHEITAAMSNSQAVWEAIENSKHIWFFSEFAGDSIQLYEMMLGKARKSRLRNKIIFNVAYRKETLERLVTRKEKIYSQMQWLERRRNMRFVFLEEISRAICGRQPAYQNLNNLRTPFWASIGQLLKMGNRRFGT